MAERNRAPKELISYFEETVCEFVKDGGHELGDGEFVKGADVHTFNFAYPENSHGFKGVQPLACSRLFASVTEKRGFVDIVTHLDDEIRAVTQLCWEENKKPHIWFRKEKGRNSNIVFSEEWGLTDIHLYAFVNALREASK